MAQYGGDPQISEPQKQSRVGGGSRSRAERLPSWARPLERDNRHGEQAATKSLSESDVRTMSGPGRPVEDPEAVPLGGGIGWLLAAGIGYGAYRLRFNHGLEESYADND